MSALKSIQRILAFIGKEIVEIWRRPTVVLSLTLGPFLILLLFGLGYQGFRRPLETGLVVPANAGLPTDPEPYKDLNIGGLSLSLVTTDEAAARQMLGDRKLDLLVIAPADTEKQFEAGQQSTIQVLYNTVDPIAASYAGLGAQQIAAAVNRQIIKVAVEEGQNYALAAGDANAQKIPADVIASPTRAESVNVAPTVPRVEAYFGAAALALILQHMAVTLVALSIVRERTAGRLEVFRIAPVNAIEILVGKVAALGLLVAFVAAILVGLLVGVIGVPLLGSPATIALILLALVGASLSVGVAIAVLSDTERQAVQLSLLILIASVFFGGFVIAVDEFLPFARGVAYLLPVTHGASLLQDVMLRGSTTAWWHLGALGALAFGLLMISWALFRRTVRHT